MILPRCMLYRYSFLYSDGVSRRARFVECGFFYPTRSAVGVRHDSELIQLPPCPRFFVSCLDTPFPRGIVPHPACVNQARFFPQRPSEYPTAQLSFLDSRKSREAASLPTQSSTFAFYSATHYHLLSPSTQLSPLRIFPLMLTECSRQGLDGVQLSTLRCAIDNGAASRRSSICSSPP